MKEKKQRREGHIYNKNIDRTAPNKRLLTTASFKLLLSPLSL